MFPVMEPGSRRGFRFAVGALGFCRRCPSRRGWRSAILTMLTAARPQL